LLKSSPQAKARLSLQDCSSSSAELP
jgi:hypothetical protein